MNEKENNVSDETGATCTGRQVSRRDFLKTVGVVGVMGGLGTGVASLIAGCGGETTATTTKPTDTQTTGQSNTSVSASAEAGREVRIGLVTPVTGGLAAFGFTDSYNVERWEEAVKDGLVCGDGKNHPISILSSDSQSDSNRAAQVAADLVNNDNVDMLMAASTPDTCVPVADQAEALGCPCIETETPWEPWFFGRNGDPQVGFKWTYLFFWGLNKVQPTFLDVWEQLPNNKVVGSLWPNDTEGIANRESWTPVLPEAGYKLVDGGAFQGGTEDFTSIISMFKEGGVEIVTGDCNPPDFANFWAQSMQQSFKPVFCTVAKANMFPMAVEAVGDSALYVTSDVYWAPSFPYKSSLTGETCQQYADDFEKRAGQQWTQPLVHHVLFEIAVDTLKRTKDLDDKQAIVDALGSTKLDTLNGLVDFSSPVQDGSRHPVKNVYESNLVVGQWVKGAKHKFDLVVVGNKMAPEVPVQAKVVPLF